MTHAVKGEVIVETSMMNRVFEQLSETGKAEVIDFIFFLADREKQIQNAAYLAKLEKADEQICAGRVVVKTLEELEAMAE